MSQLIKLSDVRTALALLTRLPVRAAFDRSAQAVWAWPVAGLLVAFLAALPALALHGLGLPLALAGLVAMATGIGLTGAMHEDGLADCADGFWGGWERARRLEIMRDSVLGSYGALALAFAVLAKWSALTEAGALLGPLVAAAVLGRAAMGLLAALVPHARSDGLSVRTGRPPRRAAAAGAALGLAISWLAVGFVATVIAASIAGLLAFLWARIARARIGGQTGDVLGACEVLCEIAVLFTLAALA